MSKGSLFWANARGKLGESVFYRSGGEQRNRTYVKNIKNPKTEAQMRNRIQMANWAAMYRRLKPILSKTFTNRLTNESGFNALVRLNKSRLRIAIDNEMLRECDYIPVGAAVSSGTIVCNVQPQLLEWSDPSEAGTPPSYWTQMMALDDVNLTLGANETPRDGLTGSKLFQLLTANGNPMGLPSEFKVITMYGSIDVDDETGEWATGGMPLSYRVYDCSASNETTGTFVGNHDFADQTILVGQYSEWTSNGDKTGATGVVSGLMMGYSIDADEKKADCVGLIIYYEDSNGAHANNAFIYGYPTAVSYTKDFSEGGDVFNDILAQSGYNAGDVLTGSAKVRHANFNPYAIEIPVAEEGGEGEKEEEP